MRGWPPFSRSSAERMKPWPHARKPRAWSPHATATRWTPSAGGCEPDAECADRARRVTRASAAWRIAAALAVAGCAAAAPSLEDDPAAVARRIAARARDTQIVYLGESHDNPHHHVDQARVLEAILAGGARPAL